jgi:hypothetical protein
MFGMYCEYRPDHHKIIHPRFEEWMKRRVHNKDARDRLFVYLHTQHLNFVIAQWAPRRGKFKKFSDVVNLGHSLELTGDKKMQFVQNVCDPHSTKDVARSIKASCQRVEDDMIDGLMEEREQRLRRENKTGKVSLLIRSGYA